MKQGVEVGMLSSGQIIYDTRHLSPQGMHKPGKYYMIKDIWVSKKPETNPISDAMDVSKNLNATRPSIEPTAYPE